MRGLPVYLLACCLPGLTLSEDASKHIPPELRPEAEKAKKQFESGDYAGAEKSYREMLKEAPHKLYINYPGITASNKGWAAVAVRELEHAIASDPSYADAYFNLAVVLAIHSPPWKDDSRKYCQGALKLGAERDAALEKLIDWSPETSKPAEPSKPSGPPKPGDAPHSPPALFPGNREATLRLGSLPTPERL